MTQDRLARYHAKRDFGVTPEPAGSRADGGSGRFVVQRHRAGRPHYDLRLEVNGLLASWSVPKGPTLDPKSRQLAVHVEDHPIEYYDFEGVIPKGSYGGGDVIVWDWGTWEPAKTSDPAAAIKKGELHFDLHGEKLAGRFVLVRRGDDDQWLLIHKDDDHAERGWDPEDRPKSVKSGRTNDEVAAAPEVLWRSDLPAPEAAQPVEPWEAPTADELAALDDLGGSGTWELAGRRVKVTNLDKVLFPGERPVSKRDLIRYYAMIGPHLLPYLADRPINTHRFPNGVTEGGFWQKEVPDHAPDWLKQWHDAEADPDKTQCYAVLDSVPALVWMANYGAVELHPWTSALPDVHQPTWALIDIDPGTSSTFDDVLVLARLYRTALEHMKVEGMPKVTGQRGVQIWVPVRPGYTFDDTRAWVEKVSRAIGRTVPELVSWQWQKSRRGGKARLDYTQNAINKTLVAPFSTRPRPGAPVSVPITWDELDDPDLRPDGWTLWTVLDRLAERGDPLAPLIGKPQTLPKL
ncbi:non-homologous end-joining DNA ligase [Labedaea rhizosphaerae]|uniref:Bifunctional non-homologous end joining protein LigD n=1 Tax=Labedaea rhizosphaerae TaxID=598644 RepID=A0A4R6S5U2_LABRH|nr:non-homologous end-joining DNA ligase [Labedaea rhizosphaerae]TDP94115.1 bifunctional non-homologous end joining protein LigD [Labedaea rhizosphaerae]